MLWYPGFPERIRSHDTGFSIKRVFMAACNRRTPAAQMSLLRRSTTSTLVKRFKFVANRSPSRVCKPNSYRYSALTHTNPCFLTPGAYQETPPAAAGMLHNCCAKEMALKNMQLLRKRDGAQEHGHRANVVVEAAGLGTERPLRDQSPTHVAYCVEDLLLMHVHQTLCGTQCLCTERRFDNMQPRRQRAKTVVGHVDRLPELELQQGVVVILRRNEAMLHGKRMLCEQLLKASPCYPPEQVPLAHFIHAALFKKQKSC
jgi:hypothetical protein